MVQNKAELAVGALVLAVAIAFFVYAGSSVGLVTRATGYDIVASFRSVEGITVGTDVRLAGVKIGSVADLSLNAETFRADATLAIEEGIQLPEDSSIIVASEGLLGGNFIEILPGGSQFNLEPGARVTDTQGAVSLIELLSRFVSGSEN